jgi:hypothetical protein
MRIVNSLFSLFFLISWGGVIPAATRILEGFFGSLPCQKAGL